MRTRSALYSLAALVALSVAIVYFAASRPGEILRRADLDDTFTVDVIDYHPPPPKLEEELVDDELSEKNPNFIPELTDRRPEGSWQINASAAVLRLDVPMLRPDGDAPLLVLRRSYADAIANAPYGIKFLPSINLLDGKAKQFDDGLFAAVDLAYYKGLKPRLESHVKLIERLFERVGRASPASPYLAAGLKIAGVEAKTDQPEQVGFWLDRFESDAKYSKPFAFYTWSDELTKVFRFLRFFQQPLPRDKSSVIRDLGRAVGSDANLLGDYKTMNAFYARLTNPLDNLTLVDVFEHGGELRSPKEIAVFPSCRSKETELFWRLFPDGLPPGADLMREMIQAIRTGKVDLAPKADSGWYEYQVHALETFLLPEKGEEHAKLMLTKAYKKRMLEAFQALITKRRETHSRTAKSAEPAARVAPPAEIKPRLRVEPSPSYYLRTARSYDFLLNFLLAAIGEAGLSSLHGLAEGGERSKSLLEELRWMREFFYGIHLLCAEDIGMAPALRPDEPVDRAACEAKAVEWLDNFGKDPDLQVDTRVSVPLYYDVIQHRTRLWATLGVRLAKLDVAYAKPPMIKPKEEKAEWVEVKPHQVRSVEYVIAVDDFAEVEIPGVGPLSRKEFRDVCDSQKTKPEIVEAISRRAP